MKDHIHYPNDLLSMVTSKCIFICQTIIIPYSIVIIIFYHSIIYMLFIVILRLDSC